MKNIPSRNPVTPSAVARTLCEIYGIGGKDGVLQRFCQPPFAPNPFVESKMLAAALMRVAVESKNDQ